MEGTVFKLPVASQLKHERLPNYNWGEQNKHYNGEANKNSFLRSTYMNSLPGIYGFQLYKTRKRAEIRK